MPSDYRPPLRRRVQTRAVAPGPLRVASIDNTAEGLAIVEGENFK
jgi:hypothetical protein